MYPASYGPFALIVEAIFGSVLVMTGFSMPILFFFDQALMEEFLQLRTNHDRAIRIPVGILVEIILVIVFGLIEFRKRHDLRHDGVLEFRLRGGFRFLCGGLLRVVLVENHGPVLGAVIWSLPVEGRRIVRGPEYFQERLKTDLRGVELQLHHLGMAGFPGANLLVGRVGHVPTRIAGSHGFDSLQALEYGLHAPKTSSTEGDALRGGRLVGSGFSFHRISRESQRGSDSDGDGKKREEADFHGGIWEGRSLETTRIRSPFNA